MGIFYIDSVLYISAVRGKSGGNGSEKNRNRTGLCMAGRIYRGFCILCSSRFRSAKQDEEAGCCLGRIPGEFAYEVADEDSAKAEVYRMGLTVGKWNDMIEERKKLFRETVERYSANDSRLLETKDNILGKYEEFVQKYGDVKKSIRHISRRHLRAYPNMVSSFERRRRLTLKKNRKQNKKSA